MSRSAGAAREVPRLVAARDLEPPPQACGADAERADGVIRMTEIWPCVRTWNPSIGLHACRCVLSAPARNRLLASAMNQTKLPFPAGARFLWPATVGPGDPARRREWSGLFPILPRFTKPAADGTEPGRGPSKRFPSNAGVRRLRRRIFHENPCTPYRRTRSEARFRFVAGNRDTACLTPRLTDRGIVLAFAMPSIPLLCHGSEIGLRYRDLPGKEGGHGREARDSRCPTLVYPMSIRTAPTVNFVAPDATRQGRSLSSLLHFARRLPSPSRRNAPAADPGSSAIGGRSRTYRRSPPLRKVRLFSSPGTPAGGSHPSPATLARSPGTKAETKKK